MSYTSIASALVTILNWVRDAGSSKLADVYDYDAPTPDSWDGYPFACLVNGDLDEEILDTTDNKATYNFIIRVKDLAGENKSTTESRMRSLCDSIMVELRKYTNLYLSNTVDNVLPFNVKWWWDTANGVPIRVFEISIKAQKSFTTL